MNFQSLCFCLILPMLINCQFENKPKTAVILMSSNDFGKTWDDISTGLPNGWRASYIYADSHEIMVGSERELFRKNRHTASSVWNKEYYFQDHLGGILQGKEGPYVYDFWMGLFQEGLRGSGLWEPRFKGVTDAAVRTVIELSNNQLLIGCDNGIFKSVDGGASWKQVFDSTMIFQFVLKEGILIAGGSEGVLRSSDGGEHWSWVAKGYGPIRKVRVIGDQIAVVTNGVGPWEEMMKEADGTANSMLFSSDGGVSWKAMENGLTADRFLYDPEKEINAKFIHDIIRVDGYLLCSHDTGISRSADGGQTWELILPIEYGQLYGFAIAQKTIYLAKVGILGGC
jgi:hypothetical protein